MKKIMIGVMLIMFAAQAMAQEADSEGRILGKDGKLDFDKIIMTASASTGLSKKMTSPAVFNTKYFTLLMDANGKPVSLKSKTTGEELLDTTRESKGFYMKHIGDDASPTGIRLEDQEKHRTELERQYFAGEMPFKSMETLGDGKYVLLGHKKERRLVISVKEYSHHISFHIERMIRMPKACGMSLHFDMAVKDRNQVRVMELDYMTETGDRNLDNNTLFRNKLPVHWFWTWYRAPNAPKGAFALYVRENDEQEDEVLYQVWGTEKSLPHPDVPGEWNPERVKSWMDEWCKEFSDTSVFWCTQNPREKIPGATFHFFDELMPYLERAGIKEIQLMGWHWVDNKHHGWVQKNELFPEGRKSLKKLTDYLKTKGMRITFHYNFNSINPDDPVFIGKKPHADLATWGSGTLMRGIDEKETTLVFMPDKGVELPFKIWPYWFRVNPPALHCAAYANCFQIGNEIIKAGEILNSDTDIWVLKNCERGLGLTDAAAHGDKSPAKGLITYFNHVFMPDPEKPLFDLMVSDIAGLVNECNISHLEYDGVNPTIWSNGQWAYRKFLGGFYSQTKRPVTFGSGAWDTTAWGYFENFFNRAKNLFGEYLGPRGDLSARIRIHTSSREATSFDEIQMRLSQLAAYNKNDFALFIALHFDNDWKKYGKFGEVADLLKDWKTASHLMTQKQRDIIKSTLFPPLERGYQTRNVFRLSKTDKEYIVTPTKNPLTRKEGDIVWGTAGGECGYANPQQYIKPGNKLSLENPYKAQEPQFMIHVWDAYDYKSSENIDINPALSDISNPTTTKIEKKGDKLVFSAENNTDKLQDNIAHDAHYPGWSHKMSASDHHGIGMYVNGDNSGSQLVLRTDRNRDYTVKIDFTGTRYVEIVNGQVFMADGNWGGPLRSHFTRTSHKRTFYKLGFGKIQPETKTKVSVHGVKALKNIPTELVNPVIHVGKKGTLKIKGSVKSLEYIEFKGGNEVIIYDENWHERRRLPVEKSGYKMKNGYEDIWITSDGKNVSEQPWMSVRFITEGKPFTVKR